MTRGGFVAGGAGLALAHGAAIVAVADGATAASLAQRLALVVGPTLVPFLLGALSPAGRRTLWSGIAVTTSIGWASAAIGLHAARADASFAVLHGWAACTIAGAVALGVVLVGALRDRRARS